MCPFCFATVALVAAGMVSTGGLTAVAVSFSRKKDDVEESVPNSNEGRGADPDTPVDNSKRRQRR